MRGVVWEVRWREIPDLPCVGDYIQLRVSTMENQKCETLQGFVLAVLEDGGIELAEWPEDDRYWDCWRRGALPEYQHATRRETVDA